MIKTDAYLPAKTIEKKIREAGLGLKETLALIEMTWPDTPQGSPALPFGQVFNNLDHLISSTVKGTRLKRYKPDGKTQPFQAIEAYTQEGELLAYLNMLYLRKPLPCYYLVYVEVAPAFRGKGLGNRILESFRDYVEEKGAIGMLDNIIPTEEPTFDIYAKLGWKPIDEFAVLHNGWGQGHYLIFIPPGLRTNQFALKLPQLLFNLKKKRPVIDMQDNELMVHRTIQEFNQIYRALEKLFRDELENGRSNPLMRFMFTKFTTRLLSFRRRIQDLLGYTGGESLEQISLSPQVGALPIQSYNFDPSPEADLHVWGEHSFWDSLPDPLKENPSRFIEKLPLYQRPFWVHWLQRSQKTDPLQLTIADLLDLGFDPTRLHEFHHRGERYIFERVSPMLLEDIKSRKTLLAKISRKTSGLRIAQTQIITNPPLVWLQHRGNGYIVREKVAGIHWEEAVSHLRKNPGLELLNRQLGLDGTLARGIREITQWVQQPLRLTERTIFQNLAFFVPWNLEGNRPLFSIDGSNQPFLETVWLA